MRLLNTILLFLSLIFFSCTSMSVGFSSKTLYIADAFSNRTLSGASIGIGPILSKKSLHFNDSAGSELLCKTVVAIRPDLNMTSFNQIEENFSPKFSVHQCDSLFLLLYSKSSFELQLQDSLWKLVQCDYLMLVRLRDAMRIKTFNNVDKKRVRFEAELWNCKDQEVSWRIEVSGIADGNKITDKQFILESIKRIFSELPTTVPSYDNGKW